MRSYILTTYPVVHSEESLPYAVKIQVDDRIISYSGDTEWTDVLIDVAKNADLFICGTNFFERESTGHLNYQNIVQNKHKLECKKLLLTHLGEEMLNNLSQVKMEYAEDGDVISV
ncbi:MAG: hypothetical protein ABII90_02595 [Bacteroidota bacterium]